MIKIITPALSLLLAAGCKPLEKEVEETTHVIITQETFNKEAERLYSEGLYPLTRGNNSLAFRRFTKSLEYNPNHPMSNYMVGRWLLTKGDYQGAEEKILKAIENEKDDFQIRFYKATLRLARRMQEATIRIDLENTF